MDGLRGSVAVASSTALGDPGAETVSATSIAASSVSDFFSAGTSDATSCLGALVSSSSGKIECWAVKSLTLSGRGEMTGLWGDTDFTEESLLWLLWFERTSERSRTLAAELAVGRAILARKSLLGAF